jgi:hypothetical protein
MYGFRKPFTAGTYEGVVAFAAVNQKIWLVSSQLIGYTLSKIIGIRVIAAMPPGRRAMLLLAFIGVAELSLVAFAMLPFPANGFCLFLNGLPLGMVFGLVLGFVEGRRMTELFVAGLCASFIVADGYAKTVGGQLLKSGVSEAWMPAAAGAWFALPLCFFVWMLTRIPPPADHDVAERSERTPMSADSRNAMIRRHGWPLFTIVAAYLLITMLRTVRSDFAPEIWAGLGFKAAPTTFTDSELWVALGVILFNGSLVLIRNNRIAFFSALAICGLGLLLALGAIVGQRVGAIPPFAFMILLGIGAYLPYVAVHTTIFERLIALTREKGNIGFLMYIADAVGYLGVVLLLLLKSVLDKQKASGGFLDFFLNLSNVLLTGSVALIGLAIFLYGRKQMGGVTRPQNANPV